MRRIAWTSTTIMLGGYWLAQDGDKAWHFLAADDKWQDSYYGADNQLKSAELAFWLGASPAADAVPTSNQDGSTRQRPALQAQTSGMTPAFGPHAAQVPTTRRSVRAGARKPA